MRRKNWHNQMEQDRQVLRHVLAMIFYLAGLFGPDMPRPFRLFLLRALRPAGSSGAEFIVALTPAALAPVMIGIATRNGDPNDIQIDQRLYALGLMLAALASQVRNMGRCAASMHKRRPRRVNVMHCRPASAGVSLSVIGAAFAGATGFGPTPFPDTS